MDHNYSTTIIPDRERGQHLGFEERCSIKIFRKLGYPLRKIGEAINCSASTVLNELRRGTGTRNGNRGRFPEYSAKRGQKNYEINRSRCHKAHKIEQAQPFVDWTVKQIKEYNWSFDVCVGYAKKHALFPEEQIVSTKTLYNKLWAENLPLAPLDMPEVLSRKQRKHTEHRNKRNFGKSIDERP